MLSDSHVGSFCTVVYNCTKYTTITMPEVSRKS
jgi:hypothetical protein